MRKTTKLYCGDVRAVVKDLGEATVDAVLTDPPYEIGFLGQGWDASGVAFRSETWQEMLRICKPGALLLAFGSTRTYHHVATAIEEAGWDVRDCLQWLRGNGVPKNSDRTDTLGAAWKGYGDSLKPGHDPIILARTPCDGTTVRNAMEFGCGLLNLDACRISRRANMPIRESSVSEAIEMGKTPIPTAGVRRTSSWMRRRLSFLKNNRRGRVAFITVRGRRRGRETPGCRRVLSTTIPA